MRKLLLISIFLPLSTLNTAIGQTGHQVSTSPEFDSAFLGYFIAAKPQFYQLQTAMKPNEMHVLDTLSFTERSFIEAGTDPPRIGIIRTLPEPIVFNLDSTDIPSTGEISLSGGRLSRINTDTLVFTTCIKSLRADEIRIFFSKGHFPGGVLVNLFGEGGFAMSQSDIPNQLTEFGFYTTTTFSESVYIQVIIPVEVVGGNLFFFITKVVHVDNRYLPKINLNDCYEDANCPYASGYNNINSLKKAVARINFPVSGGYSQCSAGLLNDVRDEDHQPFLLTANHCFSTQSSANGLEARFDYWSTYCNSGVINPNIILVSGANLLATNPVTDVTMVLLRKKPAGSRTYLGWNTGEVINSEVLHSVHHPNGTLQKYSRHSKTTAPSYNCSDTPPGFFHYTNSLGGQNSPGSSGGVCVNSDNQVVGQLRGTCYGSYIDECDYNTFNNVWGRFDVSYNMNNFQYWLFGGGASVNMDVSPVNALSFGVVNVGSYKDLVVTITNNGTVPDYLNLEAGTISITGSHADQYSVVGISSLYLSPGTSGVFTIRFSPTSGGTKSAVLNIPNNSDNLVSPVAIYLTGGCPAPAQPGNISGIITPCQGSLYVYNIPAVTGATSYTWTFSGMGSLTGYGTSCTLDPVTSGSLMVTANNSCGSSVARTANITVAPLPDDAGIISGSSMECQGQSTIAYSIPAINFATSYVWTLPSGVIGSSTTNSINVDLTLSAVSGNIAVKGQNTCGTGKESKKFLTVNPIPPTPIIYQNGNMLSSNATFGNQWYRNGSAISGANGQNHLIVQAGSYYVIVTALGCSSEKSNIIQTTDIEDVRKEYLTIHPNPVKDELEIEVSPPGMNRKVELISATGKVIFSAVMEKNLMIDMSKMAGGEYVVKLITEKSVVIKKVIKQ